MAKPNSGTSCDPGSEAQRCSIQAYRSHPAIEWSLTQECSIG